MCCTVRFSSPDMHEVVSLSPHWHMLGSKRSTPVLSLLKVTHLLGGRLKPGGRPMFRLKQNWEEVVMSFHEFIHALLISNPEWQHGVGKGVSNSDAVIWDSADLGWNRRGVWLLNAAWHPSLYVKLFPAQVWWCNACWSRQYPGWGGTQTARNKAQRVV